MGTKIGSLIIDLALEYGLLKSGLSASEKEIAKATKAIERKGKEIADFGQKMSLAITLPIAGLAAASIKAAKESSDAIGQVNAALTSMGDASGKTAEQLQALAASQMRQSLYDDDQILREVTANLLTFGKVSEQQFDRAQQAALDLATRMQGDLKGATIQIGKALQDPVKGVAALKKVGIDFSVAQKAMIASLVETGDVAGAQQVILAELERQFAGSAKAAREADPGAALAQSWANFQEEVGGKLLPLLPAFTDALTRMIDAFSNLPDGAQQAIIVIAGLAAAVGPVAMVLGNIVTASAGTVAMFSTLGLTFGGVVAAAAPFIAVAVGIAAAAYAIYANWDKIAPVLEEVWTNLQKVLGPPIEKLVGSAMGLLTALWEGPLGGMIRTVIGVVTELGTAWLSVMGDVLPRVLNAAISIIGSVFEQIANIIDLVTAVLRGDFAGAWEAVKAIIATSVKGILRAIVAAFPESLKYVSALYVGVKTWLQDKMGAVFDWVGKKIEQVKGFFFNLYDAVVGNSYIPDMVEGIRVEMAKLDAFMVEPARKATKKTDDTMRELAERVRGHLRDLYPEIEAANAKAARIADLFAAGAAGKLSAPARRDAVRRAPGIDQGPLEEADKVRRAAEELGQTLIGVGATAKVQTVQIAESFRDMADKTVQAFDRMASALKGGGFLDILGAGINLFLQLGSTGLFGKSLAANINAPRIPGNANGTAFHPGGLMEVGERGPEILQVPRGGRVIPNHELRQAGAQRLQVEVVANNNGFGAMVRNAAGQVVAEAAPSLMAGSAQVTTAQLAQRQTRRIGR